MKKIIATVAIILSLALGFSAIAEVRYEHLRIETIENAKGVKEDHYYGTIVSESGSSAEIELSFEEFSKAWKAYEKDAKKQAKAAEKAEKKSKAKNRSWLANIGSTLTFWNPND